NGTDSVVTSVSGYLRWTYLRVRSEGVPSNLIIRRQTVIIDVSFPFLRSPTIKTAPSLPDRESHVRLCLISSDRDRDRNCGARSHPRRALGRSPAVSPPPIPERLRRPGRSRPDRPSAQLRNYRLAREPIIIMRSPLTA